MATTKNAIYKVHNGTDFDTIHFQTSAEQVIAKDGSNLETHLADYASHKTVQYPYIISFVNGWEARAVSVFGFCTYYKDRYRVYLSGVVDNANASYPHMTTLPVGYRPAMNLRFIDARGNMIEIHPDGKILSPDMSGWVYLFGISFDIRD